MNDARHLPVLRRDTSLLTLLGRFFVRGLLIFLPVVGTVYVFYFLFTFVDRWLGFRIPGVGFLVTLGIIFLLGYLASNLLTRWLIDLMELVFSRLPFVKLFYNAIKDLIGAFVGDQRRFDRPVRVRLPGLGDTYLLGFITQDDLEALDLKDHVAVYVPQSYNFAGNLLMFPRANVTVVSQNSADVMTFIVSGGVSNRFSTSLTSSRS